MFELSYSCEQFCTVSRSHRVFWRRQHPCVKVAVNTRNKLSWTTNKGWSSSCDDGCGTKRAWYEISQLAWDLRRSLNAVVNLGGYTTFRILIKWAVSSLRGWTLTERRDRMISVSASNSKGPGFNPSDRLVWDFSCFFFRLPSLVRREHYSRPRSLPPTQVLIG